ncbi:MAG TPA: SRPBCC family protein [Blastocatellia bacterium]|nr:SRPBCC family protein [Blastocatellia bacterium]
MNKTMGVISSLGIGAGLMYLFDPDRGNRRRSRVRNKIQRVANKTDDAIGKTSRDLANRLSGIVAEAESLVFTRGKASNEVLVARVRAKLGRVVSHPRSIDVKAEDGRVTLSGPILAKEVDALLERVRAIRGVAGVENRLEGHEQAGTVSGLQGGRVNLDERSALMQTNWSPTARLLAVLGGGALVVYAVKRRGLIGATIGPVGFAVLSRALTNLEIKRIVGLEVGPGTIDIEKTINIAAPVEEVFDFWSHHEKFPQFMSNVREVKKIGEGKYHWIVAGPAGVSVEWDAEITKFVPNQVIAFRSLPGAAIEQSGLIHFTPTSEGDTSVDIKMCYNPPAGAIGHLVAMLFGADPKREMDEDLMRMKSFIETGEIPHDAAQKQSVASAAK